MNLDELKFGIPRSVWSVWLISRFRWADRATVTPKKAGQPYRIKYVGNLMQIISGMRIFGVGILLPEAVL